MKLVLRVILPAVLVCTAMAAIAANSSANLTPAGSASNLTGSGTDFTINGSPLLVTCATAAAAVTLKNPAAKTAVTAANNVTFSNGGGDCSTNQAGVTAGVATPAGGTWTILQGASLGGGSWVVTITTPQVVITIKSNGIPVCTITVPAGTSIGGVWTNTAKQLVVDNDITVNGNGGPCGGAGQTATFTGVFTDKTLVLT